MELTKPYVWSIISYEQKLPPQLGFVDPNEYGITAGISVYNYYDVDSASKKEDSAFSFSLETIDRTASPEKHQLISCVDDEVLWANKFMETDLYLEKDEEDQLKLLDSFAKQLEHG